MARCDFSPTTGLRSDAPARYLAATWLLTATIARESTHGPGTPKTSLPHCLTEDGDYNDTTICDLFSPHKRPSP